MTVTKLEFKYQSQLPTPKWMLMVYLDGETKGGMLFDTIADAQQIGRLLIPGSYNEASIEGGTSWTPA